MSTLFQKLPGPTGIRDIPTRKRASRFSGTGFFSPFCSFLGFPAFLSLFVGSVSAIRCAIIQKNGLNASFGRRFLNIHISKRKSARPTKLGWALGRTHAMDGPGGLLPICITGACHTRPARCISIDLVRKPDVTSYLLCGLNNECSVEAPTRHHSIPTHYHDGAPTQKHLCICARNASC